MLPGVTVEAASPALIEKVRSAVTSSDGTYSIPDLRPGLYSVSFSLPGFSSVKRDGVNLPAAFTATVSVSMQVGSIEETITVTGAAPLVDIHNATSQTVLSNDMIQILPSSSRSPQSLAALTPGVRGAGLAAPPGGVNDMGASAHGAAASDYQIGGMTTATINGMQGGSITFRIAQAYVGEIAVSTGGGMAESSYGNMVTNVIPKEGGNTFTGGFYVAHHLRESGGLGPHLHAARALRKVAPRCHHSAGSQSSPASSLRRCLIAGVTIAMKYASRSLRCGVAPDRYPLAPA